MNDIHTKAIELLSRREHSQQELRQKLRQREFSDGDIDEVLINLKQQGLQSDERFTESYIRMRVARGYGPQRIAQELNQRGLEDSLIDRYFIEYKTQWFECARHARQKKFGDLNEPDFKELTRQMRFLQYRGFTTEQINAIITTE